MRSLVILGILLLKNLPSNAETNQVNYSFTRTEVSGRTSVVAAGDTNQMTSLNHSISFASKVLANQYRVRAGAVSSELDLTQYIVRDELNNENSLGERFDGKSTIANLGGDILYGTLTLGVDLVRTLETVLLKNDATSARLSYRNYKYGLDLSYQWELLTLTRPENYFTSPENFRRVYLGGKLHRRRHEMGFKKIINENLRTAASIKIQEQSEDRPSHMGGRGTLIYGLNDFAAISTSYESIKESTEFLPRDGSGRFSLSSYELGLAYELSYRYQLFTSYALVIEEETARGSTPFQKIGTDSYGLSVKARFRQISIAINANYQISNTEREAFFSNGVITWEI